MKGLHLHFDPLSGIAGDMTVAALVDLGVPRNVVLDAVKAMGVKGLIVKFEARKRGAFMGTGFVVKMLTAKKPHSHDHPHDHHHDHPHDHSHDHHHDHQHGHEHRDYAEIKRLLKKSALEKSTREIAEQVFARVAEVEGKMHGVPADKVSFHEVGAYDSIADIVGAAAAFSYLAPVGVTSSPPVLGTGQVRTEHGLVAIPAPATAGLLHGIPTRSEGKGELTTPTGAALLAVFVKSFTPPPAMTLVGQGFGAGTREQPDRPNVLRVLLGRPIGESLPDSASAVCLVQANIDDMNPQLVEPLLEALFAAGAVDAWTAPITMKKGRPALTVSALAPVNATAAVSQAFFANSTTIGVRHCELGRTVLQRSIVSVKTAFGPVKVKVVAQDGVVMGANPEFDDCQRLAHKRGVPVLQVHADAVAAAHAFLQSGRRAAGRG